MQRPVRARGRSLALLSACVVPAFAGLALAGPAGTVLAPADEQALRLGHQVNAVAAALHRPEVESSIDAVRTLGLQTRYHVMVRGWILQHIAMAESYRGTSAYRESAQRQAEVEGRITALGKMLKAIDLE